MDAGSLLIILLTVALVGVTTWYAFQTHRISDAAVESVKVAKEAARSAAESAALAERTAQILDEQLTVEALPVVTFTGLTLKTNPNGNPEVDGVLVNVGSGPALNVNLAIAELDQDSHLTKNRGPSPPIPVGVPVGTGDDPRSFSFLPGAMPNWDHLVETGDYALVAYYHDAMGREWRSVSPREQVGRPVRVERLDPDTLEYRRYI